MEHVSKTLAKFQSGTPGQKNSSIFDEPEESPAARRSRSLKGLGVLDLNHTFNSLKRVKGFDETLKAFKDMATGQANYWMLMVYGGVGNGKSHLCEATVIEMFDRGLRVKRDRWSDVVRTMKSHFNSRDREMIPYGEYFANLRSRARLIFDDVGSGSTLGSWEWGELEDIIDYRYERRLFTIVTTNMDIKSFPERILSRFRDRTKARLILNESVDHRPLL